jgi:hypothetical protein
VRAHHHAWQHGSTLAGRFPLWIMQTQNVLVQNFINTIFDKAIGYLLAGWSDKCMHYFMSSHQSLQNFVTSFAPVIDYVIVVKQQVYYYIIENIDK